MGGGVFEDLKDLALQINGRGTTGWFGSPKQSYNIKLDSKEEICGMTKSKKWALRDNYHDRSLLRDKFVSFVSQAVFTNLGWEPTNVICDFVLNGEYKGTYVLTERIKIESGRLNIKDISKVEDIKQGGFICEVDERFDEAFHFRTTNGRNTYTGNDGVAVCLKDPDEVTDEVFDYIRSTIQEAEDALFSDNFKDPQTGYAYFFDVDALVDWYLIHEFSCMYDACDFYTSAFFFYDSEDRKIHMGPCWDYDTGLRCDVDWLEFRQINSWYCRLFEDEQFNSLVKKRWSEIKDNLKTSIKKIYEFADEINVSAQFNFMRWPVLGTPYEGLDEWAQLKTYSDQVDFLKNWADNRIEVMDNFITNN